MTLCFYFNISNWLWPEIDPWCSPHPYFTPASHETPFSFHLFSNSKCHDLPPSRSTQNMGIVSASSLALCPLKPFGNPVSSTFFYTVTSVPTSPANSPAQAALLFHLDFAVVSQADSWPPVLSLSLMSCSTQQSKWYNVLQLKVESCRSSV